MSRPGQAVLFRGPLADGAPPALLEVNAPPIEVFTPREVRRTVDVGWALVTRVGCASARSLVRSRPSRARMATDVSEGVVDAFEHLGPTFVKVGQLMASSPMLVPEPLADAARRCLDRVIPVDAATILRVIEKDLGAPARTIFADFHEEPLSAASIAQVHACVLRDGRDAVVKVQRPHLRGRINADLRVVHQMAKLAARNRRLNQANPVGMVADLHRTTNEELNFVLEASRQDRFRANLHTLPGNEAVTAAQVYWEHCGPRVICMERLYGTPVDRIDPTDAAVNGFDLLRHGIKAWIEAACVHGPFHGDMHAGNLWLLDDGRAAFLDFGIMGELPLGYREAMRDMLRTMIVDQDYTRIPSALKQLGLLAPDAGDDRELGSQFGAFLEPLLSMTISSVNIGELLQTVMTLAAQFSHVQAPAEVLLVAKQFLYLERYMAKLAPNWTLLQDQWLLQNTLPPECLAEVREPHAG